MTTRKFIIRETALLTLGEAVCYAAMIGVFALLGQLDYTVFLGGALGILLAVGNFFFMALAANVAADKAAEQQVKAGKATVKLSYGARLMVMAILLFLFAKSGHCNLLALVCPLFFVFPIITVIEFFRKTGEAKS